MDIDRIVEQHDSRYINGQKHMFWTPFDEWQDNDDEEPEADEYEVGYTGTDGQEWFVYLTRSQYEHALTLTGTERVRYLESV